MLKRSMIEFRTDKIGWSVLML